MVQEIVSVVRRFHSLCDDVPARLSAIFGVWFFPAASTGW